MEKLAELCSLCDENPWHGQRLGGRQGKSLKLGIAKATGEDECVLNPLKLLHSLRS